MNFTRDSLTDEEFNRLFDEVLYAFDGADLFFRKARHGSSFVRADR